MLDPYRISIVYNYSEVFINLYKPLFLAVFPYDRLKDSHCTSLLKKEKYIHVPSDNVTSGAQGHLGHPGGGAVLRARAVSEHGRPLAQE